MTEEMNRKRIDFENCITRAALESGLELGTVIRSLSAVQYRFNLAKENLANKADVRKAEEYAERRLFIDQDGQAVIEDAPEEPGPKKKKVMMYKDGRPGYAEKEI